MKYPGSDIRYIPRIPLYGEEEKKPMNDGNANLKIRSRKKKVMKVKLDQQKALKALEEFTAKIADAITVEEVTKETTDGIL